MFGGMIFYRNRNVDKTGATLPIIPKPELFGGIFGARESLRNHPGLVTNPLDLTGRGWICHHKSSPKFIPIASFIDSLWLGGAKKTFKPKIAGPWYAGYQLDNHENQRTTIP